MTILKEYQKTTILGEATMRSDVKEKIQEADDFSNKLKSLSIESQTDLDNAAELVKATKRRYKEIDDLRKGMTEPLNELKRKIMDLFRPVLDNLKNTESVIKGSINTFTLKEIQRVQQEEIRAAMMAEKEEAKKRELLLKRAQTAETNGDEIKSESFREMAAGVFVPPVISQQVARSNGVFSTTRWKFRVTNLNKVPREYLMLNTELMPPMTKAAQVMANGKKVIDCLIPGIEFYENSSVVVRA